MIASWKFWRKPPSCFGVEAVWSIPPAHFPQRKMSKPSSIFFPSMRNLRLKNSRLFFDAGQPSWAHPALPQLVHTHRLWPHRQRGEGHFVAVLRKSTSAHLARTKAPSGKWVSKMPTAYAAFAGQFIVNAPSGPFLLFGEHLYQPPCQAPSLDGLRICVPGSI